MSSRTAKSATVAVNKPASEISKKTVVTTGNPSPVLSTIRKSSEENMRYSFLLHSILRFLCGRVSSDGNGL